jgi:hypothetical protein
MAGQGTYLPRQLAADKRLIGPEADDTDIHVVEHSPVLSGWTTQGRGPVRRLIGQGVLLLAPWLDAIVARQVESIDPA